MSLALVPADQNSDAEPKNPRDRLAHWAKLGHLTQQDLDAGNHLLLLRERSQRVVYAAANNSSGGRGNLNPLEAQQSAKRRYDRMVEHVGELAAVVLHAVVICNMGVKDAARVADVHPKAVIPILRVALHVIGAEARLP